MHQHNNHSNIAEIARSWVGVPFKYRGFTKYGCDCAGLLIGILKEAGFEQHNLINLYTNHRKGNGRYIDAEQLSQTFENNCKRIQNLNAAKPGDIMLFKIKRSLPNHLSIVSRIDTLYIIHSHRSVGYVVENILDNHWKSNLSSIYRIVSQ